MDPSDLEKLNGLLDKDVEIREVSVENLTFARRYNLPMTSPPENKGTS
jgi:hypothetical protein